MDSTDIASGGGRRSKEEDKKLIEEEPSKRKRLYKKTPEDQWLMMKPFKVQEEEDDGFLHIEDQSEDEDQETDETKVAKTVSLAEVMANLERWKKPIQDELESQYQKGSLKKIDQKTKEELMKNLGTKVLPSKGVFVIKPSKDKCRIVACGNYEPKETKEDNYAGGADATAIRTALRRSVMEAWTTASKDVSTAFLNADYDTSQGVLILTLPHVVVAAGLMQKGEAWIVYKAIYGLRVSPKLWSLERNNKIQRMQLTVKGEQLKTQKMKSDENSWHIINEEGKSKGIINTYVDDILVMSTEDITRAMMTELDNTWKCSEAEYLTPEKDLTFCGMTLKKVPEGLILHEKGYTAEILKRHNASEMNPTKMILDREECEGTTTEAEKEELPYEEALRRSQKVAGELLWLSTRTRPDLSYPIQRIGNVQSKDPWRALKMAKKVLRYLRGSANVGLLYRTAEEVQKLREKVGESWPEETDDAEVTTVWTDSSFAPQGQKSQGALVVTMAMAPVFWKCGVQTMVSTSTAECELMEMIEGNLASMSVGEIIHEAVTYTHLTLPTNR